MTRATQTTMVPEIDELEERASYEETSIMPSDWMLYAMPITKGQERLWSIDQLNPGNPALNMPLMWRCTGPLDLVLMAEAFTQLVERHESLRTTFDLVRGRVMGIIGESWTVPIAVVDIQDSPDFETSARAKELIDEHAGFRFNLRSGPLLTVKALRFGPVNHLLLVTLHHIICDGVSTGVVLRDVAAIYQSLIEGRDALLLQLPLQFADFAVWQQEWRETQEYADSLNFWRKSLGTNFSHIQLPHDEALDREALLKKRTPSGEIETLLLAPELAQKIHEFCKRNFITHNVFFSSVFSLLLSRISGLQDLLIGSPCANRVLNTEQLVGMFMNIQAMRVVLQKSDTFQTLIERVQQWSLHAYENQQLPFEDLVDDPYLSSGRGSFELPVFFLYQKSFMVTHHIGDLTIVPLRSMSPGAAFEIFFAVVDREEEGTRLQWEYDPRKTRKETIQKYLDAYVALLECALDNPGALLENACQTSAANLLVQAEHADPREALNPADIELAADHRSYRDAIDFQLVELWQATLGIPYISVDDGFYSLGVSSLNALRLINKMNRIYSTDLGLSSLFSAPNIRAIAELIRDRLSPNMHSSLVPIQPAGSKRPLFVIHGIRGNILSFYGLAVNLGKDQPVYGIQAQALVSGEPALLRLPDMAQYYIAEMRKVQPYGPYNLLGYSFGGTMAMEMAHQLRAVGEEVGLLGMLDSKSPEFLKVLRKARKTQAKTQAKTSPPDLKWVSSGDPVRPSRDERIEAIVERVRSRLIRIACQVGVPLGLKTLPSFMKNPWSINYVANSHYRPKVYDGRMTLFRAALQPIPNASEDLGWGPFFTGGVDIHELPGTHQTLWTEQNIKTFAESVAESLRSTEA